MIFRVTPGVRVPQVASAHERHGPFVTYLHRFDLCSHNRCVCDAKGDPNHYATVCPVTKSFHFMKPSAENLSTWWENIVQDKRSMARLTTQIAILVCSKFAADLHSKSANLSRQVCKCETSLQQVSASLEVTIG
ncbi:hypothetical protein AVEN_249019-1 [Araneus ventricosus]|uniref:Uncharacterized protein n=1 Tax=Araneus ventricosus TaxID=182803 RepID=A0A4Y2PRA4_ARAVE|nr:hypothetical protein AVEN_249019-1 [Araneus ventricosus]